MTLLIVLFQSFILALFILKEHKRLGITAIFIVCLAANAIIIKESVEKITHQKFFLTCKEGARNEKN